MRLRSRMVGDAEDDEPAVASASSSGMDENGSTEAVLGSPVTRRSWSTTHDSQEQPHAQPLLASSATNPNSYDLQAYQNEPQPPREQYPYLTSYETTAHTEYEEYPATISDSSELHSSQPQTHHAEESNAYVQTSPPLLQSQATSYPPYYPQTPVQPQSQHASYQTLNVTPYSQTRPQPQLQRASDLDPYLTPSSQLTSRVYDYDQSNPGSRYSTFPAYSQQPPAPGTAYAVLPPFQPNDYGQQLHLQTPASASETLNRYVTSDNEDDSWSPAAQTNPETNKRRISQADETVGFRDNKLRTELDELEEGGEGSQQGQRKRRRRARGSRRGRGKGKERSRDRDGDRDRGNGGGRRGDKRDRGGYGGREQGRREVRA